MQGVFGCIPSDRAIGERLRPASLLMVRLLLGDVIMDSGDGCGKIEGLVGGKTLDVLTDYVSCPVDPRTTL